MAPPPRRHPTRVAALLLAAAAAAAGCAAVAEGPEVAALPFLERERALPSAPRTTDLLCPFGLVAESPGRRASGVRPLWRDVATETRGRLEVLYPLYRQWGEGEEFHAVLFPFYWRDVLPTSRGTDTDTAVVPFLWWGEEPGEGSWFLFLPFGGTVKQKFLLDEGTFVLFPLYLGSRNGEYRGTHLLWPLVHWGSGGGRSAARVLPFFSVSGKDGVYRRRSVLWPVVHWGTEDMDTPHPRSGWLVWPLLGRETSDVSSATTLLWPFFSWADGPRATARDLPFPFWRRRTTRDEKGAVETDLFWLWPFYGRYDSASDRSRFYAWPLLWRTELEEGGMLETAWTLAPLYTHHRRVPAGTVKCPVGTPAETWWKLWPLAQGATAADGASQWSALSIIPIVRWPEFEANWGVFFEVLRHRRDADGSTADDALFSLVRVRRGPAGESSRVPGLFRTERGAGGSEWRLLEGLLGGSYGGKEGSSLRLLWFLRIPLGGGDRR